MTYFYVTRKEGDGFVGLLTLVEIRTMLAAGVLKESFFATESDGRSFSQFRGSSDGRWRTLAALLAEHPAVVPPPAPEPARPSRRLAEHFQGGSIAGLLLGAGALTAAVVCAAVPVVLALQLMTVPSGPRLGAVLVGVWSFCVSAAMVVVYLRALVAETVAADQDLENQRLWRAIEALQRKDATPPATGDREPSDSPQQPVGGG